MSNQVELPPCPSDCGGKTGTLRNADGWWAVWCDCGWQGPLYERKADAITAWNTRSLATLRDTDEDARRFVQPCDEHEYIEANCPNCGQRAALRLASPTPAEPDEPTEAQRLKEFLSKPYEGGSDNHGS